MKINKVLIANRGEIAVRIIRACHKLGLEAVAVYSEADRDAPYTRLADQAVCIGKPEAKESYLNQDKIIAAAKATCANAVHPGYGFLAENAEFAQKCIDEGLTFVGPSPEIIAQMGSKMAAKEAAVQSGVPVVPGYHGGNQNPSFLLDEAEKVGLPLLIKASAGGGGRGMRRVYDLEQFETELKSAQIEAEAAFGDPIVLLERFIETSRHVEVQILADKHGTALHLFERDCSIQRNHQKVIEEAPAPNLPESVRQGMLDSAVRLTETIGYDSAGTVEYIYDPATEEYFFLEMNTRLQVEHPVSEIITGIDLVEWQLRVAGGEKLPHKQADITCTGWAMEARLAAEDPAENFKPQTGQIKTYNEPECENLRIDSGISQGSVVSHHYDSMLAKVIAKGRDRSTAIRNLDRALHQLEISGVGLNSAFISDVLNLDVFQKGEHHTGVLSQTWPDGWVQSPMTDLQRAEMVLAKLISSEGQENSPWHQLGAWRLTETAGKSGNSIFYFKDDTSDVIKLTGSGRLGTYSVSRDEEILLSAKNVSFENNLLTYESNDIRKSVTITVKDECVTLFDKKNTFNCSLLTPEQALLGSLGSQEDDGRQIVAPMPGMIAEIRVKEGQKIGAGQVVVVIEAMKMLQDLTAPQAGTIESIRFQEGAPVEGGATLVTIELSETE